MAKELRVVIAGDSSALQAALRRASGATEGFAASVSRVGSTVAATGAGLTRHLTLPIVGLGALSAKAAVDFQNAMELLHTQAGLAQSSIAGLSKEVLALAGPTATAPDHLAAGLYHLSSQGLRGASALHALKIAAEGAKMGQADLEDVTNALGAVLASKIEGVTSYSQAMGELNATVGAGDMRMQDLADAMGTGLPAKAAVAGVSLRDVAAALAVYGDNNIRGAEAGTLMNSTMRLMEGPSNAAAKAMKKIGLNAEDLGNTLRNKGLVAAVELLKHHLDSLSKEDQVMALTRMFGGRQSGGVQILIDQLGRLKQKVGEVKEGGDKFAKNWSDYTQTAAYHLSSMGAALEASGVTIGTMLLPLVSELTNKISEAVQWFDGLSSSTRKMILAWAAVAATLGPAMSLFGNAIKLVGGLGEAVMFLAANPLVLVVAAIVALAAAAAAAVIWPKQFKSVLESLGLSASQAASVLKFLQTVFADMRAVVQAVVTGIEALWARFGDVILAEARNVWSTIKAVVSGALTIIRGLVNIFGGLYTGDWSRVWNGIKQVFSGAWGVIKALVVGALNSIKNAMTMQARVAEAIWTAAWHAISASASSAWAGIRSAVGKAVDGLVSAIRSGLNKALAFVKSLPGEFLSLGEAAGAALLRGVAAGIEHQLGPVLSVANKAKNAVKSVWHAAFGSTPDEWGSYAVGAPLMRGIAQGIAGNSDAATSAAGKAKQELKQSLEAKEIYGLVVQYGHQLGLKQAEGVVGGILQGTPSVVRQVHDALVEAVTKARQAVTDSRSSFKQAFGQLAGEALTAFDQKVQAWVPPSTLILQKMQGEDSANGAAEAVKSAQEQLKAAQDALNEATSPAGTQLAALVQGANEAKMALDDLNASGNASADAIDKAQAAYDHASAVLTSFQDHNASLNPNANVATLKASVVAAQAQVDAALRAQKEQDLQVSAEVEQKAFEKRMATQRDQMAKQLVALQQALLKHPAAWKGMGAKVEKVLSQFGVRMIPSGQAWASMFADGIRQGIPAAEAAAKALAKAVDDYMPHSPARKGPLAYDAAISGRAWSEMFASGFNGSFVDVNGTAGDRLTAMARGLGGSGGGGRGGNGGPMVNVEHMEVRDDVDVRLVARELAVKLGAV